MQDDLISRQAAIDAFDGVKVDERYCTEYDIGYNDGIDFAISKLSVLPSAQKRGEWIVQDGAVRCSECGEPNMEWNFCPNCGADMRGE